MIDFNIRLASRDDAEGYNAHRIRITNEPNNGTSYVANEYPYTVEDDRQRIIRVNDSDNQIILVAEFDGEIVGVCSGFSRPRIAMSHCVGIGIDVNADYRGKGIGRALMEALILWGTQNPLIHRLELEVFTDNLPALQLYLKLGFVIEGMQRNAFFKEERFIDVYLMAMLFTDKPPPVI